jgi:hypothetical protein
MKQLQQHLDSLSACAEARQWAGSRTAREAWDQCERADWLLWWAARTPANNQQAIVRAACACARTALQYVPASEDRPRLAIEAAERWVNDPTEENRQAAEAAAWAAWAAETEAGNAGFTATEWAAAGAAEAAAWWATEWAAEAVAEELAHKQMCALVRECLVLPWSETELETGGRGHD